MSGASDAVGRVDAILRRASTLLPHQGPLDVFVHANPLESLEELPFAEALDRAAAEVRARVWPDEETLRGMLRDGRIDPCELEAVLGEVESIRSSSDGLPDGAALRGLLVRHGLERRHWRVRAFLQAEGHRQPALDRVGAPARAALAEGCRRVLAGTDATALLELITGSRVHRVGLERLREQFGAGSLDEAADRALADDDAAASLGFGMLCGLARRHVTEPPVTRRFDLEPVHEQVDETLLPLVSAVLDRGQASLLPRLTGLWAAGIARLARRPPWRTVARPLRELGATEALDTLLWQIDADEAHHEAVLRTVLAARAGWAGAVAVAAHRGGPGLVEYAALRLVATIGALRLRGIEPTVLVDAGAEEAPGAGTQADRVAQLLALSGIGPDRARDLPDAAWRRVLELLRDTGPARRCQALHEARERTVHRGWLAALSVAPAVTPSAPRVQLVCCLDEREESFRRAVEEVGGDQVETFGVAGFFGLSLRWRGAEDAHASARCPPTLDPTHDVVELAPAAPVRRAAGRAGYRLDRLSATALGGAAASLALGIPALAGLAWRVWAPHASTTTLRRLARGVAAPAPVALDRSAFSVDEAADRVASVLVSAGLTLHLAPFVLVLGHGSTSLNNPHESAHDCGACGGSRGDGNARVFAELANDPAVRAALPDRGVTVPHTTVFVGAYHDTASDEVRCWWPGPAPADVIDLLHRARQVAARERCRRFATASSQLSAPAALAHVEGRSADLGQVRPEYGHATNAMLVVGPRARTRALFLDRRAFLHSYDAEADIDGTVLRGILAAAIPVCAGISLEYWFSRIDNERWGAGTKIPHNVEGLHGVMNGALGDLRVGLPWQMVEIHEPVRLLVAVFAPRDRVATAIDALPRVRRLVRHGWVRLAAIDERGAAWWRGAGFEPAELPPAELRTVAHALDWYRGRRDPLDIARLEAR